MIADVQTSTTASVFDRIVEQYVAAVRQFAGFLVAADPPVTRIADVGRPHIEAVKAHISVRGGYKTNATLSKTTIGMRLGHLHAFFHRINTWGYDDAPSRIPIMLGDKPIRDKPLPRFLDDPSAAKLLQAARNLPEQFDRLAVELLARTGVFSRGQSPCASVIL